jgi:hypothetical protein
MAALGLASMIYPGAAMAASGSGKDPVSMLSLPQDSLQDQALF